MQRSPAGAPRDGVGVAVDPAHLISLGVTVVVGSVTAALLFRWD
ncbi:hypothetical protein [Promicromonospora sp. NPDC090134]